MQQAELSRVGPAIDLARDILESYASADRGSKRIYGHDSGPMVLASVAQSLGTISDELLRRVARRWLDDLPDNIQSVGAFGGMGGYLAGVRAGIVVDERFSSLHDALIDQAGHWLAGIQWRSSSVAWIDYDLFHGPTGLVLAGAVDPASSVPLVPAARHLAQLCDDPGLERLRAGTEISPRSAFNIGRINTGMGHGVTGVVSALRHAVETFVDGSGYRPALRRACDWLVNEAYLADRDFITWPPIGRDGASASGVADRRQAWCYGTPGVAWTLWDAGRVLEDDSLQFLGEEAMKSYCKVFDFDFHFPIDDSREELAVCHGAAGTLAVADAFARHALLREAEDLRDQLEPYLLDRENEISDIGRTDMTMLSGAGGIVSVMLTVRGGTRDWLSLLALR